MTFGGTKPTKTPYFFYAIIIFMNDIKASRQLKTINYLPNKDTKYMTKTNKSIAKYCIPTLFTIHYSLFTPSESEALR